MQKGNRHTPGRGWRSAALRVALVGIGATLLLVAAPAEAQTDFYNLDRNRPVRIEDAYATERNALEVKLAPLRLERATDGDYHWGFDPEISYGILPRTSIEIGLPLAIVDAGEAGRTSGIGGLELSAFHNLNTETRGLPALAIRADVLLPVGNLAPERTYPSLTGILTRTYPWARFHANAQYTFGPETDGSGDADVVLHGPSRWLAGLAVDRAFPLGAYLLIADVHAQQPLHDADPVEWTVGTGIRYQVNPYLAVDGGIGRQFTGDAKWYLTFGTAFHFGIF